MVFVLIPSLVISGLFPWLTILSMALILALLYMNRTLYYFFYNKRGLVFTLKVIPWHWLYFFYGGAAFAYGILKHSLKSLVPSQKISN